MNKYLLDVTSWFHSYISYLEKEEDNLLTKSIETNKLCLTYCEIFYACSYLITFEKYRMIWISHKYSPSEYFPQNMLNALMITMQIIINYQTI